MFTYKWRQQIERMGDENTGKETMVTTVNLTFDDKDINCRPDQNIHVLYLIAHVCSRLYVQRSYKKHVMCMKLG